MRVAVLVVHEPSRFDVLGFVVQYGVVVFLHVGLHPVPERPVVVIVLQNVGPVVPLGQMPLSGYGSHSGSRGQHGLMQYCVVPVQLVDPHGIVVVPLDPPELVVPLDPPELVVPLDPPELVELIPELLVAPELDEDRPLDDPPLDDPLLC